MSHNVLDRYRVIAKLGHGGMADVYLAASHGPAGFSKLLVLKVLHAELARTGEFLTMFRDEARLAARLNHPNIVQTYEVGESEGRHFIAMEYLEGQPLNRVLDKLGQKGPISLGVSLRIAIDALSGLNYAHELPDLDGKPLGVVHRDITPQNVFVTYEGQVKLVDFGIAKAFDSSTHTKVGTVKGKVAYMAPEQARGEAVTRTADVFSMGVLLWELLAGRRLWEGLTDIAVIGRLVQGEIPNISTVRPELPEALATQVMRALSPDPTARPQTAEELQKSLELELENLSNPVTSRHLGELMRDGFRDQRARVREVVQKQLQRLLRETPSGEASPVGFHFGSYGPGDVPVVGEGSFVHDAPTTIHTGITGELTASQTADASTRPTATTLGTPKNRVQGASRALTIFALLAVGGAGLTLGVTQPWKSISGAPDADRAHSPLGSDVQAEARSGVASARPDAKPIEERCLVDNKPVVELTGEVTGDATLTCDKDYLLRFTTFVTSGATLTIEAGTQILGDLDTKGTLVVQPGARINARGTPQSPIIFTSASKGVKKAGDWGGLILLGEAPTNLKDGAGAEVQGHVEGIARGGEYGGKKPNDSSGVLSYVRIEYSGTEIAPNNEINGLTLGGVGRGTVIDHVQVRHTADDCFEFFGGTVDAKYLACQHPDDDAFDWDYGYTGRLQFLVAQLSPTVKNDSHGFEGDNDPNGSTNQPVSSPVIYNATLCGKNRRMEAEEHYGILLRRGSEMRLRNAIFTGFSAGLDVRDVETKANIAASIFFNNLVYNLAYPESPVAKSTQKLLRDDDAGFNERAYLSILGLRIGEESPQIGNCFDSNRPGFAPQEPLIEQAALPPRDGFFDHKAQFVGAFRDQRDTWGGGSWLVWSD